MMTYGESRFMHSFFEELKEVVQVTYRGNFFFLVNIHKFFYSLLDKMLIENVCFICRVCNK